MLKRTVYHCDGCVENSSSGYGPYARSLSVVLPLMDDARGPRTGSVECGENTRHKRI